MIEAHRWLRPAVAVALVATALAGCQEEGASDEPTGLPRGVLTIQAADGPVEITVEIAETLTAKVRGLMGRRMLPPDAGMVFLEDRPTDGSFWMKDTLIPLSIGFWGRDGRLFRILDMEPCRTEPCPHYEPGGLWVGAVEVNQGYFERHGIEVGDRVRLER